MRRLSLAPARAVPVEAGALFVSDAPAHGRADVARSDLLPAISHAALRSPAPAHQAPRRFFDPASGWFRRLEKETSLWLSRHLLPRVPGLTIPYGAILERTLTAAEAEVAIPGLGDGLDGLRILLITDIHTGPFLSPRSLERTLSRARALRPDLVLVAGDFATGRPDDIVPHEKALATLTAPFGVFAVLGNHDHYTREPDSLARRLADCGMSVLQNRAVAIERGSARLVLAGIDDLNAGRPDLDAALGEARAIDPAAPMVLMSHNPDVFFAAALRGVRLVLAGHTHGGQMRVPGWPVLVRMSRYRLDEGRYAWNGSELIVSRGLGVTGLPLRACCPPEVVLVTLRRAPAA